MLQNGEYLLTGSSGFIGRNIVTKLNSYGIAHQKLSFGSPAREQGLDLGEVRSVIFAGGATPKHADESNHLNTLSDINFIKEILDL